MAASLIPNATPLEAALDAVIAARFASWQPDIDRAKDPDLCPPSLLPWLAWEASVDTWSSDWTETQKRAVIKAALDVHRHKGTPAAVQSGINALGFGITVNEWFTTGSAPYTFIVDAQTENALTEQLMDAALDVIKVTKNVRSHLGGVSLAMAVTGPVPVLASALTTGEQGTIYPPITTTATTLGSPYRAAALQSAEYVTIYPGTA